MKEVEAGELWEELLESGKSDEETLALDWTFVSLVVS